VTRQVVEHGAKCQEAAERHEDRHQAVELLARPNDVDDEKIRTGVGEQHDQ
jgi:hypothetical protein